MAPQTLMLSLPALNLAWSPASHPAVGGVSRAAVRMQYNSPFPDLKLPDLPKPPAGLPELDLKQLQKLASPDTQRELQNLAGELRDLAQSQDPQVVLLDPFSDASAAPSLAAGSIGDRSTPALSLSATTRATASRTISGASSPSRTAAGSEAYAPQSPAGATAS